ncbi:hypothetical protein CDAR_430051 [Caerostris darwini]|uniref:Uncharacterized protein n=1 Tax=Caerostris darwini TaxID=1538125 RepID=A0AAV4WGB3_9ARAC|nr:hypothetical protein CDAR_430051 [Caerostris darwini]
MVSQRNYGQNETCRSVDHQTIISWCVEGSWRQVTGASLFGGEGERRLHRGEFIFARFKGGRRRIREESSSKWLSSQDDGRSLRSRHSADVREHSRQGPFALRVTHFVLTSLAV